MTHTEQQPALSLLLMVSSCAGSGEDYGDEALRHGKNTRFEGLKSQEVQEN